MRVFERHYFHPPVPATIDDQFASQQVLINDISIDGVRFTFKDPVKINLNGELQLTFDIETPERRTITMRLLLVGLEPPIYRCMWNPCNEHHGIALTQWVKRLLGDEDRFYTRSDKHK